MAQVTILSAPNVRAAVGLLRHDIGRQLAEKGEYLIPPQLLAQKRTPRGGNALRLKHILRQIEFNCGNR